MAADPLRLSTGGAEPVVATSDVLCRPVAARARAPSLAFAVVPPVFRQVARRDLGARTPNMAARLEAITSEPRTPSVGSDLDLAAKRVAFAHPVTASRRPSHPFARCARAPPSSRKCRHPVLPRAPSTGLAADLGHAGKMLLTDLCNRPCARAPVERSSSGHAACAATTAGRFPPRYWTSWVLPCGARPPCGNRAPAEARLTACLSASVNSLTANASHPSRSSTRRGPLGPRAIRAFSARVTLANDL